MEKVVQLLDMAVVMQKLKENEMEEEEMMRLLILIRFCLLFFSLQDFIFFHNDRKKFYHFSR